MITNLEKNIDWIEEQAVLKGMEKGMETGMEKGIEKGMETAVETVALKMLRKGLDTFLIQDITGLSEAKIEALKSQLN